MLAATSALHRDVPGLRSKSSRSSSARAAEKDALARRDPDHVPVYLPRGECRSEAGLTSSTGLGEEDAVEWLEAIDGLEGVADVEQRWKSSWRQSIRAM